jgi:hypothetical protein
MTSERLGDCERVDVEQGAEEVVGIDRLLAVGSEGGLGEVAGVEGHDAFCARDDGCREDVAVAGVVRHRRLDRREGGRVDHGFREDGRDRLPQAFGLGGVDALVGDEVATGLVEDPFTEGVVVQLVVGEPEQGVAEGRRVEDVGVEDDFESHCPDAAASD